MFLANISIAQMDMELAEKQINEKLEILRKAKTNMEREVANMDLEEVMEKYLAYKETFEYPFSSFKTMGTITSPDKAFRLFNWNVEQEDGTHKYFCYLVKNDKNRRRNTVVKFEDKSLMMKRHPVQAQLDSRRWYGALYYKIIPVKKGMKTFYTLLALDVNTRITNKKFIEVMYISGKKIKFGYPLIKDEKGQKVNRYFLEYQSDLNVSMKHYKMKKEEKIIFDHLEPKAEQLTGMYEHYVSEGTNDSFLFVDGYWVFQSDEKAENEEVKGQKYTDPKKAKHKNKEFKQKPIGG